MSMSYAEDSPARIYRVQGKERASTPNGRDSGGKCSGSFAWYDPDTCLWRTWQRCLTGGLMKFSGRWPKAGMMLNGEAFALTKLEPATRESDCFALPTPTASMGQKGWGISLTGRNRYSEKTQENALSFGYYPPVKLIEAMMGYPEDWTKIESDPSETP